MSRDKISEYLAKALVEYTENLVIFPNWQNKTESYDKLLKFKENWIDHVGMIRGSYKFIK